MIFWTGISVTPASRKHIRDAEAAFPRYELIAHQIVAEDDLIALRGTVQGVHEGMFAGIEPDGQTGFLRVNDLLPHQRRTDCRALDADGRANAHGSADQVAYASFG
jgi:hypothetical protein